MVEIKMITIRSANINDSESLSKFIKQLDVESQYLLYDPYERKNDPQVVKAYLSTMIYSPKSVVYLAENEYKYIVGYVCGEVSHLSRITHVMKANIGVLKQYHGLGIGRMLSEQLLHHAKKVGIRRIEVTVVRLNIISFNLCKKFGFEVEGVKKNSIRIDTVLHDELFLARLIGASEIAGK
jgi:RimJ/RimL family protein N-acetyltransferase